MNQIERREEIIRLLTENDDCITASKLASYFGVTRQVIVSDVAILRANGKKILATQKGYSMEKKQRSNGLECIACRHHYEDMRNEFYAIVDNGGCIVNVIVEHPLYGEISADLNICSRYDANEFIARSAQVNANQLSDLTNGFHLHMIRVPNEDAFRRIKQELSALGILVDMEQAASQGQ